MAQQKNERYDFTLKMLESLAQVSIEEIISLYIPLHKRGLYYLGLCPFHNDMSLGSFVVTPSLGIWKCFSCGVGGNGIKFVKEYLNKKERKGKKYSYLDAAFIVALRLKIINQQEYETYSKLSYSDSFSETIEKREEIKKKKTEKPKADRYTCHNIYKVLFESSSLSEKHQKILLKERHLPLDRIKADYFTLPSSKKSMVIEAIHRKYPNIPDKYIAFVPGFFMSEGKLDFICPKGIGILIRDKDGLIQAVQIRKDTVKSKKESRYVWFSSSFAAYQPEKYFGGAGCNSPKDVMIPKKPKDGVLCITEGRFKSEILGRYGNITISVQGVSTFKGIEQTIRALKSATPHTINVRHIYMFFDADIWGNFQLFEETEKMVKLLYKNFPSCTFRYAVWSKKEGKGIDDIIINHHMENPSNYIQFVNCRYADRISKSARRLVLEKLNITDFSELPPDVETRKKVQNMIQEYTEKLFEKEGVLSHR